MILPMCDFSSRSLASDSSPSNTEFCIQQRYCRQSFSIFPTRLWATSYTNITYMVLSSLGSTPYYIYYQYILNGLYSSMPRMSFSNL